MSSEVQNGGSELRPIGMKTKHARWFFPNEVQPENTLPKNREKAGTGDCELSYTEGLKRQKERLALCFLE